MKIVAITQRVDTRNPYEERRDALDQRWTAFIEACGAAPIPVPNLLKTVFPYMSRLQPDLILLTGGNDLARYGGDAPERDEIEGGLMEYGLTKQIPIIGVCRGMQVIQDYYNVPLQRVTGHVTRAHPIDFEGFPRKVNSYHNFGTRESCPELNVAAIAEDSVIEAITHPKLPIWGMMWHPERARPFSPDDIGFFKKCIGD